MNRQHLIVGFKGGLGNQMFQYAAGRALAIRNNMELVLDRTSGFLRDKVYRRSFSLDAFPIRAARASLLAQLPFWFERGRQVWTHRELGLITRRPWGILLTETEQRFLNEIASCHLDKDTWMDGQWASEKYFADCRDVIASELCVNEPEEANYLSMAKLIESCNSVAVGVRCYEEVPEVNTSAFKWLAPPSFYETSAKLIAEMIDNPTFFLFCTTMTGVKDKFKLPGKTYYCTGDNGFGDAVRTLWLISKCKLHIISNSSFYWWGAWLAEYHNPGATIFACDLFTNQDTIPRMWTRLPVTK